MNNQLLHTPDGVRDLYEGECEAKLLIESRIHDTFRSYGYRDIETPSYEFFDIFNKERGSIASRNMFKFFDRENNTMVLRPDITPCIARCAAKYYDNTSAPVRLCYNGRTFINNLNYQGRLAETTQAGCELITPEGQCEDRAIQDAEMIALLICSLLKSGITDFQVEVGHVGFYNGIFKEAGLTEEAASELKSIIRNKKLFMIEEFAKNYELDEKLRNTLYDLPQMFGGAELLSKALTMTTCEESIAAIKHLQRIYEILDTYQVTNYVSFDLGVMSGLNYYTGVIFRAYTYDVGEPIAGGGRYDHLLEQFGSPKNSIGFAINVDLLALAIMRQDVKLPTYSKGKLVVYHQDISKAILLANELRSHQVTATIVSVAELANIDTSVYEEVIEAERNV